MIRQVVQARPICFTYWRRTIWHNECTVPPTLDIFLTRTTERTVSNVRSSDPGISDHKAIVCSLPVGKPPAARKLLSVRNFKLINVDNLCKDLLERLDLQSLPDDVLHYDDSPHTIIDKHAPVTSKTITIRSEAVWYTEEIHEAD